MKRLLITILTAVMLLSTLAGIACAADTPVLSVQATPSADGKTVTATVSIAATQALAGLQLTLHYDAGALRVTGNPAVGGAATKMSYICNPQNIGEVILVAYSVTDVDNSGGALLTVQFAVKSGASGSTNLTVDNVELVNAALNVMDCGTLPSTSVALGTSSGGSATVVPPEVVASGDLAENTDTGAQTPVFADCTGHWAQSWIEQAAAAGLVNGMGGGYQPDGTMTRAQFVTILWRYAGSPFPQAKATFTDLDPTQLWYMDAVSWATEQGIVNGIGNNRFGPNAPMTREQMMAILFRYSGGVSGMEQLLYENAFIDDAQISSWAKSALYWAVYNSVYCGVDSVAVGKSLSPTQNATRAQIAVVMIEYKTAFGTQS